MVPVLLPIRLRSLVGGAPTRFLRIVEGLSLQQATDYQGIALMSGDTSYVFVLIGGAVALMASTRVRFDVVALLVAPLVFPFSAS